MTPLSLHAAELLARASMAKFNLHDWNFRYDNAVYRLGLCRFREKTIQLSRHYVVLNPPELVMDTILHEIAHAIAGPKAGHGLHWMAVAVTIGAQPVTCKVAKMVKGKFRATCPCGHEFRKHRRPKRTRICRTCRTPLKFSSPQ